MNPLQRLAGAFGRFRWRAHRPGRPTGGGGVGRPKCNGTNQFDTDYRNGPAVYVNHSRLLGRPVSVWPASVGRHLNWLEMAAGAAAAAAAAAATARVRAAGDS